MHILHMLTFRLFKPLKKHEHKFNVCELSIASKLSPKLDVDAISRRVLPWSNALIPYSSGHFFVLYINGWMDGL